MPKQNIVALITLVPSNPSLEGSLPSLKTVGRLIRRIREENGWGLNQFAAMVNYDSGYVSRVETGKHSASLQFVTKAYATLLEMGADVSTISLLIEWPASET